MSNKPFHDFFDRMNPKDLLKQFNQDPQEFVRQLGRLKYKALTGKDYPVKETEVEANETKNAERDCR